MEGKLPPVFTVLFTLSFILWSPLGYAGSAKTSSEDLHQQAERELKAEGTHGDNPIPSVMLPLQDTYRYVKSRPWQYNFEARLSSIQLNVPRPPLTYGVDNLSQLGTLPLVGLAIGVEKTWLSSQWQLNAVGAFTTTKSSFTTQSGAVTPVQVQYLSYGLEPAWSKRWWHWIGTTLAYPVTLAHVTQSSTATSLAQWSQNYQERGPRLALDLYVRTEGDDSDRLSLAFADLQSDFGSHDSWTLSYGVKW
jgi:hypothetical protein